MPATISRGVISASAPGDSFPVTYKQVSHLFICLGFNLFRSW